MGWLLSLVVDGYCHWLLMATVIDLCAVELRDKELRTPLHYCAQRGNVESLHHLCQPPYNACISAVDVYKDTPLHLACYHGHHNVVRLLIETLNFTDFALENVYSETILHAAVTFGKSVELVSYLLRIPGVSINQQGADGHTGSLFTVFSKVLSFLNIRSSFSATQCMLE